VHRRCEREEKSFPEKNRFRGKKGFQAQSSMVRQRGPHCVYKGKGSVCCDVKGEDCGSTARIGTAANRLGILCVGEGTSVHSGPFSGKEESPRKDICNRPGGGDQRVRSGLLAAGGKEKRLSGAFCLGGKENAACMHVRRCESERARGKKKGGDISQAPMMMGEMSCLISLVGRRGQITHDEFHRHLRH